MTLVHSFWRALMASCNRHVALAGVVLSTGLLGGCAGVVPCSRDELVYVGAEGPQIRALRFDACNGSLAALGPVADVSKSRWAVAHPQLPILYASSDNAGKDGSVIAFAVDRETGALTKVNEVTAGGAGTTHLWLDEPSMTLVAANYGGGSASTLSIQRDGSLGALVSTVKSTGTGPHRRQASPHAHGAVVDPSGRYALVSDLGADRVFVYGFDRSTHTLSPQRADPAAFVAPAGSGPRHLAFGATGRFVYLLNELTADVLTLRWDPPRGQLVLVQTVSTSSPEFQGARSGAEIGVGRDGRFVYVANRGENTLVVYRVHPESGELSLVQRTPSNGKLPWAFTLHPSGRWLLVSQKDSNTVNVFRIDPVSGMVSDTGQAAESPAPVSVTFLN
jgi:6-phosphogluconolactonase